MVSLFGRGFDSRQLHSNELKFSYKPHAIVKYVYTEAKKNGLIPNDKIFG